MSYRIELKVSAVASITVSCNGCKAKIKARSKLFGNQVYDAEAAARKAAKYLVFDKGWVFKNEGRNGIKTFCPKCMERPELATWHMQKILTK